MSSGDSETRKRILNATWRLMEESRGQGVRISDVAKAAGVSRQAVYLYFPSRAELLIATVRYVDEVHKLDERLTGLRQATGGRETLKALVDFWGNYIPEIYGLAKALLAARETDEAAAAAWEDRMKALREGCLNVTSCLERERRLAAGWNVPEAADMLFAMLSVDLWEALTIERGWLNERYVARMQAVLMNTLVAD